jgi:hypothetical protein
MEQGPEAGRARIRALVQQATVLLRDESIPRDGYYAFVCEKCAPVFGHYGYFAAETELKRRVKEIHERA